MSSLFIIFFNELDVRKFSICFRISSTSVHHKSVNSFRSLYSVKSESSNLNLSSLKLAVFGHEKDNRKMKQIFVIPDRKLTAHLNQGLICSRIWL